MTAVQAFQRARKPAEISQRRETLLAAAAELFDAEGPQGAGLNAIAARAGFTKSNVYRYFESREQVLLELFSDELVGLVDALEKALADSPSGDVAAITEAMTASFLERPRFCKLVAILSSTLEQNVSEATIVTIKTHMYVQSGRAVSALAARLPGVSPADCGWAFSMTGLLVAGMWPGAHPPPAAAAVLARPDFAHLRLDMPTDLRRTVRALLASIA